MTAAPRPGHTYGLVQAVCDVLGESEHPGLSGAEIDKLLHSIGTAARTRSANKRTDLFDASYKAEQTDGRILIQFLTRAMAPERYVREPGPRPAAPSVPEQLRFLQLQVSPVDRRSVLHRDGVGGVDPAPVTELDPWSHLVEGDSLGMTCFLQVINRDEKVDRCASRLSHRRQR